MRNKIKILLLSVVLLMSILCLVACGDDGDNSTDKPAVIERYTVIYSQEMAEDKTLSVEVGKSPSTGDIPEIVYKKGYNAVWEEKSFDSAVKDAVIKISAVYTPKTYTVTYDLDGGAFEDATTSTKVTFGQAPKLKIPTKANYNFAGYIVVSGESSININANKAWDIDSDVTVKAKYIAKSYDIIYNTDGGNSIPDGAFCFDQTITSLPTPEKTGYKFLGWKIYQDGVATGDYVVSGQKWQYQNSVTLIACWELNVSENFIYTFRANGKEDVNVTVVEGQTINSDDIPVIEQNVTGYEGTWAYNEELADFSVPASKNITFTVKYSPKQYKITFNTQGGESIADMYVKYDQENVTLPTPVKAGFVFNDSWYLGNDNISVNISKWQLDKDIELTVKWYVTVTFKQTGFADKIYKVMAGDSFNETLIPKCETSTSGVYVWDLEGKNFTNMQNSLVIEAVKLNIDLDWTENV